MDGGSLGPYRILADLGTGGMGTVHLGEVTRPVAGLEPGSKVALKLIHPHLLETEGTFKRFLREAEIGRAVDHPNVVRCHDYDALQAGGRQEHFLVMEYVEGQTLSALLAELGRVPEDLCVHVAAEIVKGLVAVHAAGAIHRDLKPDNVLITRDHEVKIMDLGVARLRDEAHRVSVPGTFVGSLSYAAPEQLGGRHATLDGRADLHALGILLYELSTGRNPFDADDATEVMRRVLHETPPKAGQLNPQLSPFFEELVDALLAKRPEDRFASAAELLQVLAQGTSSPWWSERAARLRRETRRPLRRMRIPRETSLYGREAELHRLHAAFAQAKAGQGQVLLVAGEAGIGKTRLVDEFVGLLEREGEELNFLHGSYPPGGAATAAGAFSTAYREQFGSERLESTLAGYLTQTPALVPAFAALLRGEPAPSDAVPLSRDSLQSAFVHATRGLAREHPTVILIDDLHFAPEEGRALFASVALAAATDRVCLIGTLRPGVPEGWVANVERMEHASRLNLPRLGAKDLSRLLEDAFRSRRLADELGMKIARKSDGNPLFVFEIIRGLKDGRLIARRPDGTWVTTQTIEEISVPSSVIDLVQARISALGEDDKNLLDVAACCGFAFDPAVVAETLARPLLPTLQRLAWLERKHQLVRSAGSGFAFDHHQVQEILHEGLPPSLRRAYHRRIGAALESRLEPEDDGATVALCEHALEGGDLERARRHVEAALGHLERGHLHDQAARLAQAVLEVEGVLDDEARCDLLLRVARHLDLLGRREEQERVVTEARRLASRLGDDARTVMAERSWASLLVHLHRTDEALTCLEALLEQACVRGDPRRAAAVTVHLAAVHLSARSHDAARDACERALSLAAVSGDGRTEAVAAGYLGVLDNARGRYEEARGHFARRLAMARERKDPVGMAAAAGNLGWAWQCEGRFDEARRWLEQALAGARGIGYRQLEANILGNLGRVAEARGRIEEAREHFERYALIAHEIGDPRGIASISAHRGSLAMHEGRLEAALAHHERHLADARALGDRQEEAAARGNLGLLRYWLGAPVVAQRDLDAALAIAEAIDNPRQVGWWRLFLGELAERTGDLEAAAAHLARALEVFERLGERAGRADALLARGRLHAHAGAEADAVADLDAARTALRALEMPTPLVVAEAWRAGLTDGNPDMARALLDEIGAGASACARLEALVMSWRASGREDDLEAARAVSEDLLAHAPEADRAAMRAAVSFHREVGASRERP